MKLNTLTILAILASTAAMAQEEGYKGNPHIIIPADKPHVSIPFDQQHITLPIPASEITNVFIRGYQTTLDDKTKRPRLFLLKVAIRKAPGHVYCIKIGDYIGDYRLDRTTDPEKNMELYFVRSNETVIIKAHQASETHKNKAEQAGAGYPPQSVGSPDP